MRFANRWDIENYVETFTNLRETPNLAAAALTLENLADWSDYNSDGWAYWPKPCRSAAKLIETLDTKFGEYRLADPADITTAELRKLQAPIKAFLTRQGVEHSTIIVTPTREV